MFCSLAWLFLGGLMAITVVCLPFAYAAFRIARFAAFPFGKELIDARLMGEARIPGTMLANIIWLVAAGIWVAIAHVFSAVMCIVACLFILPIFLGAPAWALAHLRLASVSLAPLGKRVVSHELATTYRARAMQPSLNVNVSANVMPR
jgi:uncharacterized membrane protein YccF (DUF307 family)